MGTPINATLTADNGCVFVIHGNWSWTQWHFSGDVYVKCPGKQVEHYHFDLSVPADSGPVEFEGGDEEAWDAYFEDDTQLRSDMTELFLNSPPD